MMSMAVHIVFLAVYNKRHCCEMCGATETGMGINNIPTKSISTLKQGCGEKHDACNVHMNALPSYFGRDGCTCQSYKTNMKLPKWSEICVCLRSLRVGVASNKIDVQTQDSQGQVLEIR